MRQERIYRNLRIRAEFIRLVRRFFIERDYLEVETPVRIPVPVPEAHIEPVESEDWVLQASPEICMKQLLAAGYGKIFQIARVFRKRERGAKHLPELTMLEWYTPGETYLDLMRMLEDLIFFIADRLNGSTALDYAGNHIDLTPPFERLAVAEAFKRFADVSMEAALETGMFDELMGIEIEPKLGFGKPVFLYDYPAEKASLARLNPDNSRVAERTELYIAGLELCNGFSELNDSDEQRRRFGIELAIKAQHSETIRPLPENFLNSLGRMPDAAGMAVGLDRLVMLFSGALVIDDVVAFTPEDLEEA